MISDLYVYIINKADKGPIIPMAKRGEDIIPMIGDYERIEELAAEAELIAQSGLHIQLLRLSNTEIIKEWNAKEEKHGH